MDDSKAESSFGLKRSIKTEKGVGDVPTFIDVEESTFDIKLQLCKCTKNGSVLSFTTEDKYELARWLIKKEPKPLFVDGMVYYVVAKDGSRWFNANDQGYITITFESVSPYGYSPIKTEYFLVEGSYNLQLENNSNVENMEYVDIDLKKVNGSFIEFVNTDLVETFRLDNLEAEDVNIKIYGEDMLYVQNKDLESKNMRTKVSKDEWLRLTYGINNIEIKTDGAFYCRITYQEKNPLI